MASEKARKQEGRQEGYGGFFGGFQLQPQSAPPVPPRGSLWADLQFLNAPNSNAAPCVCKVSDTTWKFDE
jgi:hypothetical protein